MGKGGMDRSKRRWQQSRRDVKSSGCLLKIDGSFHSQFVTVVCKAACQSQMVPESEQSDPEDLRHLAHAIDSRRIPSSSCVLPVEDSLVISQNCRRGSNEHG